MLNRISLATAIAIGLGSAANASSLVQNGSFEIFSPSYGVGAFLPRIPGDTTLANWTVGSNGALLVSDYPSYWPATDGSWSLQLGRVGPGTIQQAISGLQAGTEYVLSFNYAINPFGPIFGNYPIPFSFTVSLGSFTNTVTDASNDPRVAWQTFSMIFAFSGSNVLTFTSLQPNLDGIQPVLDNIRLTATPLPPAALLLFSGLLGIGALAWRGKRKNAAA